MFKLTTKDNMAAFNTFSVLKPMMKESYAGSKKASKIKGFKGPPSMPKAARSELPKEGCSCLDKKDCSCKKKEK